MPPELITLDAVHSTVMQVSIYETRLAQWEGMWVAGVHGCGCQHL